VGNLFFLQLCIGIIETKKNVENVTVELDSKKDARKSMSSLVKLWEKCMSVVRENVAEPVFSTWFEPVVPISFKNNELVIQVPSMFFYEYIEEKYSELLRVTLNTIFGEDIVLLYRVMVDNDNKATTDVPTSKSNCGVNKGRQEEQSNPFKKITNQDIDTQLNDNYNFANFIEGKPNKLARSAGLNIADNPGSTVFNPLFIYGKSGVGKTHLSNAIGLETKRLHPEKRVLYVAANLFMIQYTDAVRQNTQNDFLNFYQSLDVLIIDDIHEFMSKTGTQNTFFHIFNHLHRLGKQIILTCDCPPSSLKGMEDRLLTRFRWGLTAEISKPDFELRKTILQYKIKRDGLEIKPEAVDFIARNVTDNIRDLEGVLISLLAHSTINNEEIDLPLIEKVIGVAAKEETKKMLTVNLICEKVCNHFLLQKEHLYSKSRKREIALARHIAMYLSRKHTQYSLNSIGQSIGDRNHATVMHACNLIENLMKQDKSLKNNVLSLERELINSQ
jgi:chromosomal replication initiator protein